MCDMAPHEIVASWPTPELLASQGLSLEGLDGPVPAGALTGPLPLPLEVIDDLPSLEEGAPPKGVGDRLLLPGFAGHQSLTQLLRQDPHLLITLVLALPDHDPSPVNDSCSSSRPRMG